MDVYTLIDYCFDVVVYINDLYNYINPPPERVLESSYDIESDTITHQYKNNKKIYTLKINRTTQHSIKDLVKEFKKLDNDDKILNATLNDEDITEKLNELCGPSGCHMIVSPIKISYITDKPIESLVIIDNMCMEHTYAYNDEFMILD